MSAYLAKPPEMIRLWPFVVAMRTVFELVKLFDCGRQGSKLEEQQQPQTARGEQRGAAANRTDSGASEVKTRTRQHREQGI